MYRDRATTASYSMPEGRSGGERGRGGGAREGVVIGSEEGGAGGGGRGLLTERREDPPTVPPTLYYRATPSTIQNAVIEHNKCRQCLYRV